jgi:hypothetical protein
MLCVMEQTGNVTENGQGVEPGPAGGHRFRGKNKKQAWQRPKDAPVAVIRLPVRVDDPATRRRVEQLFFAMLQLKRAVQHDARALVAAYWAGPHRRQIDAKGWREELGLTREGLERAAYAHLDDSGWLKHHVTKALALHQADEVWTGVSRHLFPDAAGRFAGRPKVGSWWDYTRIPGRAKSHTTERKWETFRLHGSLAGHLATYPHPDLPASITTPHQAATLRPSVSVLAQPLRLRAPAGPSGQVPTRTITASGQPRMRKATWWDHDGPLTVVFAGGSDSARGDLVLPVRLPQGAGRWPRLLHFLGDPESWHKIDLVRRRDPSAPGGWAYEAHLMILGPGYASPATRERRAHAAGSRRIGGVDGNVSNLSVVSLPTGLDPAEGPVRSDRIVASSQEQAALDKQRRKAKGRSRARERSRRSCNPTQYGPSKHQRARAERRAQTGLAERCVQVPGGAREANTAGKPTQAYRKDQLSNGYREVRARGHADSSRTAEARRHRARLVAEQIVTTHGAWLTVEDCDIRTWFKLWGKACSAFAPGMLLRALEHECRAAGGRLIRASTTRTAMSQHCLCGARVRKSLRDRTHSCPECGLVGDRDLVSAALGAFVTFTDPEGPSTARVDYEKARHALHVFDQGLHGALRESTASCPAPPGRDHAAAAHCQVRAWRRAASAPRSAGKCTVPTPDEPPQGDHAGQTPQQPGLSTRSTGQTLD